MKDFYISMDKDDVFVGNVMNEALAKKIGLEISHDSDGHDIAIVDYSGDYYDCEGHCLLYHISLGEKLHMNADGEPTFTVTTEVYARNDIPDEEAGTIDWEYAWYYDSSYTDDESLNIYIED